MAKKSAAEASTSDFSDPAACVETDHLAKLCKATGGLENYNPPPYTIWMNVWTWSQYVAPLLVWIYCYCRLDGWTFPGALWGLPMSWGVFGIWMWGHDACHDAMFMTPKSPWNKVFSFLTLDAFIVSEHVWIIKHHKEHHSYPNSSVDGQRLVGDYFIVELWHALLMLVGYLWMDLTLVLRNKTKRHILIAAPMEAWRLYLFCTYGPYGFLVMVFGLLCIVVSR